jgi:hypothetical protein
MERIKAESDLSVFGQSAAMQLFISLLKCGDLSLKLLRYLLQGDSMKRADTVYCVVLKPWQGNIRNSVVIRPSAVNR